MLVMTGIFVLIGMVSIFNGIAQAAPPDIKVTLALDKSVYVPGDAINITMTLAGKYNIITWKGFSDSKFYLFLRFFDENGKVITSDKLSETNAITPSAPLVFPDAKGRLIQCDLVEIIKSGWVLSFGPFNVYDFYPLADKGGYFTVKAVIPIRTYPKYSVTSSGVKYAPMDSANWQGALESNVVKFTQIVDADRDDYFYPVPPPGSTDDPDCDDTNRKVHPGAVEIKGNGIDDDCNPETPDLAVAKRGTIMIKAEKQTVGTGSRPGSTKAPIADLPLRIYDKSRGSCASIIGISLQNYKSIWLGCNLPAGAGITDSSGTVSIKVAPGDYLVIGEFVSENAPKIYIGDSIGKVRSKQIKKEYLQVIVKADGSLVQAK